MSTTIKDVEFVMSNSDVKRCPKPDRPEYAFIGRSNVGKSSLINSLLQRKKLAKTSSTPGKTQLINHFSVNEHWYLVDLPGYGFAKVPIAMKKVWQAHMQDYLMNRRSLAGVVLVMDIRHPLKEFDEMMLDWAKSNGMKVHILLTKSDKLKRGPAKSTMLAVQKAIKEHGVDGTVQTFSSLSGDGVDDLRIKLAEWLVLDNLEGIPVSPNA